MGVGQAVVVASCGGGMRWWRECSSGLHVEKMTEDVKEE